MSKKDKEKDKESKLSKVANVIIFLLNTFCKFIVGFYIAKGIVLFIKALSQ